MPFTCASQAGSPMRISFALLSICVLPALIGCTTNPGSTAVATSSANPVTPVTTPSTGSSTSVANLQPYANTSGTVATYTTAGAIDLTGTFFQPLGTNGRTCGTCHQASQGMALNAASIQALFTSSSGVDPLFAAVDGANCPTAATGDAAAHSLLLNNGLLRIGIALHVTAQFKLSVVSDPYGCAVTTNATGQQVVSVYRRPLPATNLSYLSQVMWDGRDTTAALGAATTLSTNRITDLTQQATEAVAGHAQGTTVPSAANLSAIVAFEQGLFTAQSTDTLAGSLSVNGATGGPTNLANLTYYPGINDSLGNDPTGARFNQNAMTLYTAWRNSSNAQQASIARGQALFNTEDLDITNVSGLANVQRVSCTFCHDAPNLGSRSVPGTMDTGTSHAASVETDGNVSAGLRALSVPSLPVYQITGCIDPTTHAPVTYTTSDPGAGLFTGLCADVNRTKVPILRGLAARAPYFHGGSAASLAQVVAFYNARFQMRLSQNDQADLVNFLGSL